MCIRDRVKGVKGKNRLLVLVDYQGKDLNKRPDFYVLDEGDWQECLSSLKAKYGSVEIRDGYVPVWPSKTGKRPYIGATLYVSDVKAHKDRWDKLVDRLKQPPLQS